MLKGASEVLRSFQSADEISRLKIANQNALRHFSSTLLGIALAVFVSVGEPRAQEISPNHLPDADVREVIAHYKSNEPRKIVEAFRQTMPKAVSEPAFRQSVHQKLPPEMTTRTLKDPALVEILRTVLDPVLELYSRSKTYDILIIDTPTPFMMSDSGVVLAVSTGAISRSRSDDELLGYAAHEVAHEFFVKYSVYSKYLLRLVSDNGKEAALAAKVFAILSIIELQCDAFAALTLSALGYNPRDFVRGLEQTEIDFPGQSIGNHPPDAQRRTVIENVVPSRYLNVDSRRTTAFLKLKQRFT